MKFLDKLLKIAGKDKLIIDKKVGKAYIFHLCRKYGLMLIRGKLISLVYSGIAADIFVGRHVHLLEPRYLKIGNKSKIHDKVKIDALSINGVLIGSNCVLGERTVIECTGSIASLGEGIIIGNRTTFGTDCFFGAAGGIIIGDDVIGGQYIRFHSQNHNYKDLELLIREQGVTQRGIQVGNNCWIGSGAVFLDGASVGNGCVVAANALVNNEFPDNSIIGGVPARILGSRSN